MKNFAKLCGNLNQARSAKVPLLIITLVAITGFTFAALSLTGCADGSIPPGWPGSEEEPQFNPNISLNGVWQSDGGAIVTINGGTGVYVQVNTGTTWQSAVSQGYVKAGDQKFRYLTRTDERKWSGQNLIVTYNSSNPNAATGVSWENCTITLTANNQSFSTYTSAADYPTSTYTKISSSITGLGTETIPYTLTANAWANGSISVTNGEVWYSFPITYGTTYYVWLNHSTAGDGTKTGNALVYAYYSSGEDPLIFVSGEAWTTPKSFTASTSGIVKIKVGMLYPTGTYAVAYSTSSSRPGAGTHNHSYATAWTYNATQHWRECTAGDGAKTALANHTFSGNICSTCSYNKGGGGPVPIIVGDPIGPAGVEASPISLTADVWENGSIDLAASSTSVWYTFPVTVGATYYVWWNDGNTWNSSAAGDGTKTLNIEVSAVYSGGAGIFSRVNNAWLDPQTFTASETGTVKLKVATVNSRETGTYAIAYSVSSSKPSGSGGSLGVDISAPNGTWVFETGSKYVINNGDITGINATGNELFKGTYTTYGSYMTATYTHLTLAVIFKTAPNGYSLTQWYTQEQFIPAATQAWVASGGSQSLGEDIATTFAAGLLGSNTSWFELYNNGNVMTINGDAYAKVQ